MIFGALTKFQDERKGQILFYDMSEKGGEAKAATFKNYKDEKQMNPHGISVWKDRKGGKGDIKVKSSFRLTRCTVNLFLMTVYCHSWSSTILNDQLFSVKLIFLYNYSTRFF